MSISSVLSSGSQIKLYTAMYAPLYYTVMGILGNTGTIIPFCDPYNGLPNVSNFTSVGNQQVQFNSLPGAWGSFGNHNALADSTTFPYRFQGIIPYIHYNGSSEYFEINADTDYWSRGNGTVDYPFSVGAWVNKEVDGATTVIMAKLDATSGSFEREWSFDFDPGDLVLTLQDDSASVACSATADSDTDVNVWKFVCAVYDGTGGSTAANGITLYEDGAVKASTASNDGAYVSMENRNVKVTVGAKVTFPSGYGAHFHGKMAGGPLGPFYVQKELTADDIKLLYEVGRRALAL
jgi:hypothetical protein